MAKKSKPKAKSTKSKNIFKEADKDPAGKLFEKSGRVGGPAKLSKRKR